MQAPKAGLESSEPVELRRASGDPAGIDLMPYVLVSFVLYLTASIAVLYEAHPHEDAYILFKYAQNIAAGHGYVYFPGGPPAEGATDFLWLMLVTALTRVGFDVAVAAAVLNAAGCGLAAAVFVRALRTQGLTRPMQRSLAALALCVVFAGGAVAGFGGFSAMLYSALVTVLFACILSPTERNTLALPLVGITVALFRPDGVLLGGAFTLVGMVQASREGLLRPYFVRCAIAVVIGLVYMAWRLHTFGLFLPLPLYVKGHSALSGKLAALVPGWLHGAGGLRDNLLWLLRSYTSPVPFALVAAGLLFLGRRGRAVSLRQVGLALVPLALFFTALCFAHQSQNIGFRFQAPLTLPVLFLMFYVAARVLPTVGSPGARRLVIAVVALSLVPSLLYAADQFQWLVVKRRGYIDTFPARIAAHVDGDVVIALTEAGRMAFWHDAQVYDIVGLNNPKTARERPTVQYVASLHPDIVMYNHAHTLAPEIVLGPPTQVVQPFDSNTLKEMSQPLFPGESAATGPDEWSPVRLSARVLSEFLETSGAYDTYAVTYQSDYAHILGFRRGMAGEKAIVGALRDSGATAQSYSYADITGFWFAREIPWRAGER